MSEPVYNYKFVDAAGNEVKPPRPTKVRELVAVALILLGTIALSIGVGGFLDSLWAGVAVLGLVLTSVGLLLGNNK